MVELNTRDMVVLYTITQHNKQQSQKLSDKPEHARPSLAQPATITLLCGKKQPNGGLVNDFIIKNNLNIELADDSAQVYRSTRKLADAGLIYPLSSHQQFAQTELGEKLVNKLGSKPNAWPNVLKVEGDRITWPALIA